jgi:hypothetical protein
VSRPRKTSGRLAASTASTGCSAHFGPRTPVTSSAAWPCR